MEQILPKYLPGYRQEIRKLFLQRSLIFLWLGIIFFPFFALLDYIVVREHVLLFLSYRLALAAILFVFYLLIRRQPDHRLTLSLIYAAYLFGGLTITLMILEMGGFSSFYYVGLLLIAAGGFAILPLTTRQAALVGMSLYGIYVVPVYLFCEADSHDLRIFFNNSFFFLSFIIISVLQCFEESNARKRKFNLNMSLRNLNRHLHFYTNNLEDEVEKRVRRIEESELQFRELYENILDFMVLIDRDATITMANRHFYTSIGQPSEEIIGRSFLEVVHPDCLPEVEDIMLPKLFRGGTVKDFQFLMTTSFNRNIQVECNARNITKNGTSLGFQLVIRDISERKKMEDKLLQSYRLIDNSRTTAILALAKLAEFRDKDTGNHLERIREYCQILTREMAGWEKYQGYITEHYINDIYLSSILHDIGKVGIPDNILLKPDRLTADEFEIMKNHSVYGGDALKETEKLTRGQTFLTLGKEIAYYHHEKWDGTGYPCGLERHEIPLSARIVALADVYDALTSKRSYKEPFSHERARAIIVGDRGRHFDPDVVDAFLAREEAFKSTRSNMTVH